MWALVYRKEIENNVITREFKERLADWFTAEELVDLLVIPVEDVVEAFEEVINERFYDICSMIGWRVDGEDTISDWFVAEPEDS
jgi:hypothetical protein